MAAKPDQPAVIDDPESLRLGLREHGAWSEERAVTRLLHGLELSGGARHRCVARAMQLVEGARRRRDERPFLDAFLQEFGLSNQEGIALMCIAEALLRIPDDATADRLIAEQLGTGDWSAHAGRSESLFVNASTWGLMLTGGILELDPAIKSDAAGWVRRFTRKAGEPLVRLAVRRAMRIIGGEFVVGRSIEEALERSGRDADVALCSFDMLGEGARTLPDALRYLRSYEHAIDVIGAAATPGHAPHQVSGISIKLSALEPRYTLLQHERVMKRLVPRVLDLARRAAALGVELTIDAEEADRLDLSLDIVQAVALDTMTRDWPGLGLAIQAYGKRALDVVDWTAATARRCGRRMTARLVKGAYWDSEIKRAQERGLAHYPVYTRKVTTDVSYLACASRLFSHADAVRPQFATHNAHSIAAILELAPSGAEYEFQRLHGMGRLLYAEAQRQVMRFPPVRVYAPVGEHKDLLAYLVRRLLENGANTSFVNRFMDEEVAVADIVRDPITELERFGSVANPKLPLPVALYPDRKNSAGVDLGDPREIEGLRLTAAASEPTTTASRRPGAPDGDSPLLVCNPADRRDRVGSSHDATAVDIGMAFDAAGDAFPAWNRSGGGARAAVLEGAADLLESGRAEFHELLVREAGKTIQDAVSEVREAADFCRYYALGARALFGVPQRLAGPTGETNELSLQGRGVFACISPWNFPLAIFAGQITAALAAGNTVVAKPAEPTPLIAARFVRLLHEAGVPRHALQLTPSPGRAFGETAFAHASLAGVAMTGSTATAQAINRMLASRDGAIVPLIAETGGLNVMIVDSTALPEQVVDDVVSSAFMSAGQRCSALRLLFLQEDVADAMLEMLAGAMDELVIGDPADPQTDVGPVITQAAADGLMRHVERMSREARILKACRLDAAHAHGSFVAPHLIELERASQLTREEFGPLLHVVRYRADAVGDVLAAIRASGYGLTLGVQTRLESFWRDVFAHTAVGNTYVNRNMIGAVVGVQPFGGHGLSGTGPKAGGPHYLPRFAGERTLTVNTTATGGNATLLNQAN